MIAVAVIAVGLAATSRTGAPKPVKATSPDPTIATRQEKILHGVLWGLSYPQARELAEREGRPILIYFSSINDANSRMIEVSILPRPDVVHWLSRFVTIDLHTDSCPIGSLTPHERGKIGEENQGLQMLLTGDVRTPQFAVVDARGNLVARAGPYKPEELISFLKQAAASHSLRTGAGGLATWSIWAIRCAIIAGVCLFATWAVIRSERVRKTRPAARTVKSDSLMRLDARPLARRVV
jgi:hypothetical protein